MAIPRKRPNKTPRRAAGKFIEGNIGWIATTLVLLFLAVELMIKSGAHISTASFILMHSDKIQLLLILTLPYLAFSIAFLGYLSIWGARVLSKSIHSQVNLFSGTLALAGVVLVLGSFLAGGWTAPLFSLIFAYIVLDFKFDFKVKTWTIKKWKIGIEQPVGGSYRILYQRKPEFVLISVYGVIVVAMIAAHSTINIPIECDSLKVGSPIQTQVLSIDNKYAYALDPSNFKPEIIALDSLAERNLSIYPACSSSSPTKNKPIVKKPISGPTPAGNASSVPKILKIKTKHA